MNNIGKPNVIFDLLLLLLEKKIVYPSDIGFAANNISETYDAKIFSVATLLSSYLIYNSVKVTGGLMIVIMQLNSDWRFAYFQIIDQSEIDYLELLARRTQVYI